MCISSPETCCLCLRMSSPKSHPSSRYQHCMSTDYTLFHLNSDVQLIQSRDVLEKVVDTWALDQPPGWYYLIPEGWINLDRGILRRKAVRTLETKLDVEPLIKTNLITVTYQSSDPYLAARV